MTPVHPPHKKPNHVPAIMIWKQPPALWLIPLTALFVTSTLPLISGKKSGGWFSVGHSVVMIIMCFVLVHRFFGFLHRTPACDFYFALPGRRSAMFRNLNLAAITYLTGPSAVILLLNTALMRIIGIRLPAYSPGFGGLFSAISGQATAITFFSCLALYLKIIYLFLFLEIFYLLSDRAFRANVMAILINICWPVVIFLYSDATRRFLPGFPQRLSPLELPAAHWIETLFRQVLSPLSPIELSQNDPGAFWVFLILPAGALLLCHYLFCRRQAEYSRQTACVNWPFAITQWIGVLTVTLLGGYACHYIRALVSSQQGQNMNVISPAPFLIGSCLGLILSLWIFNLIRGRGKITWKPLAAGLAATLIPFALWLGIVMSGAFGYSSVCPDADNLRSIDLYYNPLYLDSTSDDQRKRTVKLTDAKDMADFLAIYREILNSENTGIAAPRTLQSRALSDAFVEKTRGALSGWNKYASSYSPFRLDAVNVLITFHTDDGRAIVREMPMPYLISNAHYRRLLLRNTRFLLGEYGGHNSHLTPYENARTIIPYPQYGRLQTQTDITLAPQASPENRLLGERIEKIVHSDNHLFVSNLCAAAATDLIPRSDEEMNRFLREAPVILRVRLTLDVPKTADSEGIGGTWTATLAIPIHPDASASMHEFIEKAWEEYRFLNEKNR